MLPDSAIDSAIENGPPAFWVDGSFPAARPGNISGLKRSCFWMQSELETNKKGFGGRWQSERCVQHNDVCAA